MNYFKETIPQTRQPYPGLRPYHYEEADLFFGRAEQINRMLTRLDDDRFLAVVGGSGSGKSSLVRAGLLPTLQQGYLPDAGTDWSFIVMRPGGDPFGNLATAFLDLWPPDGKAEDPSEIAFRNAETQATLRTSPKGFLDLLNQSAIDHKRPLLLLVDQFEEIFRFRRRGNENSDGGAKQSIYQERNDSTAFVNMLLTSAEVAACEGRPLYVVITMRSDFIGDCEVFPELPLAISNSQFLVPRMTRRQLQEVIEKPLIAFHSEAQPDLVNRILNDTGTAPDQLPLMQHALMRTSLAARDRLDRTKETVENVVMTLADYEKVGRFSDALSWHLDEAFKSLDKDQQRIAQHLFLCLCERLDGGLTRRIARVDEIVAVTQTTSSEVIDVVKVFQEQESNFIVVSPSGQLSSQSRLDISHEALLRQWSRLQTWLNDEERSVTEYLRLVETASRWESDDADLLAGRELTRAIKWKEERDPSPTWGKRHHSNYSEAIAYLDASVRADLERRRRAINNWRMIFTVMIVACLFLALTTWWALREKNNADHHEERARTSLAQIYFYPIQSGDGALTSREVASYWGLASTPEEDRSVREIFLTLALSSESETEQLLKRLDLVAHALVGLDDENRRTLLPIVLAELLVFDDQTSSRFLAAAQLCPFLTSDGVDGASVVEATDAIELAIRGEQNYERLPVLTSSLGQFGNRLPDDVANRSTDFLINAMAGAKNKHHLAQLGKALSGLGEGLPEDQADKAASMLLDKIEGEGDSMTLQKLVDAFGLLSQHISDSKVASSADRLVAEMSGKDSRRIVDLGRGLVMLGKRLPEKSAGEAANQIVEKIEKTQDQNKLQTLRGTLGDLGGQLSKTKLLDVVVKLFTKMKTECEKAKGDNKVDDQIVSQLGFAIGGMGPRLPKAQAFEAAELLLTRMNSTDDYYDLAYLGTALRDIGERLSEADADDVSKHLISKNALKSPDPNRSSCFAIPFERMGIRLSHGQATEVAQELVQLAKSVLEKNENSDLSEADRYALSRLINAIGGAQNGLSDKVANEFATTLISLIKKTPDEQELYFFRLALGKMAPHLNKQLAQEAVQASSW